MLAAMMRFWKAATPACGGSWKGMSGPAFQTIRLILVRMPLTSAISSSALASESLMPPSMTYSKVIHSRLRSGMVFSASKSAAMFHLRVMGMMDSRMTSLGALRLTASLGRTVSRAKSRMPGMMPEVLTVILDSGMRM